MGKLLWEILSGVTSTGASAIVTRTGFLAAVGLELVELALFHQLIGPTTWRQAFWLEVIEEELVKLAEASAHHYEDEEDEDRDQARAAREEHRITPYLFGRFNVWDAYLLARGSYVIAGSDIPRNVLQAGRKGLQFLGDAFAVEEIEMIGFL